MGKTKPIDGGFADRLIEEILRHYGKGSVQELNFSQIASDLSTDRATVSKVLRKEMQAPRDFFIELVKKLHINSQYIITGSSHASYIEYTNKLLHLELELRLLLDRFCNEIRGLVTKVLK